MISLNTMCLIHVGLSIRTCPNFVVSNHICVYMIEKCLNFFKKLQKNLSKQLSWQHIYKNTNHWRSLKTHVNIFPLSFQRLKIFSNHDMMKPVNWRCPWCNGYRRKKWTRRFEFKSWTRLIAFHIALIPLGKV